MNVRILLSILILFPFPCKRNIQTKQDLIFSKLWGEKGEKWSNYSKLKDFSKAGYCMSNKKIPEWAHKINVEDFGANGSDGIDDTDAIRSAIHFCPKNSVVFLPEGRYIICDTILIKKNNISIKGEGTKKTTFYFPKGLSELYKKPVKVNSQVSKNLILRSEMEAESYAASTSKEAYTTAWSWSGGFICFEKCQNVGIDDVGMSFPNKPYYGHFKEIGNNGIYFKLVKNGWARNVLFQNCDSGIFSYSSQYLTFESFTFDQYEARGKIGGHHGVDFSRSSFCLMNNAIFKNRMIHELGLEHGSHHNVYSGCSGIDLHLDHHQIDVHDNLWTDIDLGEGKSTWLNNAKAIQHTISGSTMNEVYWNIRANKSVALPDSQLNNIVIGFINNNFDYKSNGYWYEPISPSNLSPKNIFMAQLLLRRKKMSNK